MRHSEMNSGYYKGQNILLIYLNEPVNNAKKTEKRIIEYTFDFHFFLVKNLVDENQKTCTCHHNPCQKPAYNDQEPPPPLLRSLEKDLVVEV